ncbi:MAG: hypothetical protein ACOC91_03440, partial [bacterium]
MNTLKRTPPRRPADIRAAAERLSAFETDVLIRGFILHSAFRLAGRDCLAGLPPPPAQPAPAALASCLKETMEEMAGLDTALGTL